MNHAPVELAISISDALTRWGLRSLRVPGGPKRRKVGR